MSGMVQSGVDACCNVVWIALVLCWLLNPMTQRVNRGSFKDLKGYECSIDGLCCIEFWRKEDQQFGFCSVSLFYHLPVIFGKMAFKNGVEHDCEMQ